MILGIRTDQPEASVILALMSSSIESPKGASDRGPRNLDAGSESGMTLVDSTDWEAGRQLSATLLSTIEELLKRNQKTWDDLTAIVVYQGPGSFTGLRIGITVGNTIAFEQGIPIVGSTGDGWFEAGTKKIRGSKFQQIVMPVYGAEPNVTKPNK